MLVCAFYKLEVPLIPSRYSAKISKNMLPSASSSQPNC
jgi:hypothetical protein